MMRPGAFGGSLYNAAITFQALHMTVLAIIPARFASTRFPGKPLASLTGQPLIQHVVEQVTRARRIDRIIVATDDLRIFQAVHAFGGQAVMTRPDHPNGTARIAQVIGAMPVHERPAMVVNVQGDEPEIEPRVIDELIAGLEADPQAPMATLASPFAEGEDPSNPNIVKVILDTRGRAIYFSRALIPFDRDRRGPAGGVTYLKHPGLYAYRTDFLLDYAKLPPTPLEQIEQLEQLRAIEHGHRIAVIQTQVAHHGIDTPEQYQAFVARFLASRTG